MTSLYQAYNPLDPHVAECWEQQHAEQEQQNEVRITLQQSVDVQEKQGGGCIDR